tara:strand:- start:9 stop:746 length:738 start_codon:yes stop_codon:yes gene_type:complete
MTDKVSKEEMQRQMEINTKKGMYDLGAEHIIVKMKKNKIKNKYNSIINEIITSKELPIDNFKEILDNYDGDQWRILLGSFNIYYSKDKKKMLYNFYYLIDYFLLNKKKNNKEISILKENIEDLNEESSLTIKELDDLENEKNELDVINNMIYKYYIISQKIILTMFFIIFMQNLYIPIYFVKIYFFNFTYYLTKMLFDTEYIVLNTFFFTIEHYILNLIYIFITKKYKFKINIYKKIQNIIRPKI